MQCKIRHAEKVQDNTRQTKPTSDTTTHDNTKQGTVVQDKTRRDNTTECNAIQCVST